MKKKLYAVCISIVIAGLSISGLAFARKHWHARHILPVTNVNDNVVRTKSPSKLVYVTVPEWHIQFPLSAGVGSITYKISPISTTTASVATFESSTLATIDDNCKLRTEADGSVSGGTGVQLVRNQGPLFDKGFGPPAYISKDHTYYFYVLAPKGLCVSSDHEQTQFMVDDKLMTTMRQLAEQ